MIVYHGSTTVINNPLCHIGRSNLDFGQGFYVTNDKLQATQWAQRQSERSSASSIINTYEFDRDFVIKHYQYKLFPEYNLKWLDFIVQSRMGQEPWKTYDCIEGGIADDRVIDTVNLYHIGLIPAQIALKELSKHQPNHQICILNQKIINSHLHFISMEYV